VHKTAKSRCQAIFRDQKDKLKFPVAICNFAALFHTLQERRHRADYDYRANVTITDVKGYIDEAENVIIKLGSVPARHRKAFAVWIALPVHDQDGH
jgi:hypothetical protein